MSITYMYILVQINIFISFYYLMKDIFPLNALLAIITKYGVTILDEVRKSMLTPCLKKLNPFFRAEW